MEENSSEIRINFVLPVQCYVHQVSASNLVSFCCFSLAVCLKSGKPYCLVCSFNNQIPILFFLSLLSLSLCFLLYSPSVLKPKGMGDKKLHYTIVSCGYKLNRAIHFVYKTILVQNRYICLICTVLGKFRYLSFDTYRVSYDFDYMPTPSNPKAKLFITMLQDWLCCHQSDMLSCYYQKSIKNFLNKLISEEMSYQHV